MQGSNNPAFAPARGSHADRDARIASRRGMGWNDASSPTTRRAVKRATSKARRARARQQRHALLRDGGAS